jgi:hypothetical protein
MHGIAAVAKAVAKVRTLGAMDSLAELPMRWEQTGELAQSFCFQGFVLHSQDSQGAALRLVQSGEP